MSKNRFPPGVSGNLKGRPRSGESLAEAVRAKWPAERLAELQSKWALSEDPAVSQRAIDWLGDRGYGRVPQTVDVNPPGGDGDIDLSKLPVEKLVELEAMIGALLESDEQE